jgi:hypothetical protein
MVIPGPLEGRSPESKSTGLWKMDFGLADARRPGMTGLAVAQHGFDPVGLTPL